MPNAECEMRVERHVGGSEVAMIVSEAPLEGDSYEIVAKC